jgi:hypothetical protein
MLIDKRVCFDCKREFRLPPETPESDSVATMIGKKAQNMLPEKFEWKPCDSQHEKRRDKNRQQPVTMHHTTCHAKS